MLMSSAPERAPTSSLFFPLLCCQDLRRPDSALLALSGWHFAWAVATYSEDQLSLCAKPINLGTVYGCSTDLDFIKVLLARLPTLNEVGALRMLV